MASSPPPSNTFRASPRPLATQELVDVNAIKAHAEAIEAILAKYQGCYKSLAMTAFEEAVMWAVKQITS